MPNRVRCSSENLKRKQKRTNVKGKRFDRKSYGEGTPINKNLRNTIVWKCMRYEYYIQYIGLRSKVLTAYANLFQKYKISTRVTITCIETSSHTVSLSEIFINRRALVTQNSRYAKVFVSFEVWLR